MDALDPTPHVLLTVVGGPQLGERRGVDERELGTGAVPRVRELDPLFDRECVQRLHLLRSCWLVEWPIDGHLGELAVFASKRDLHAATAVPPHLVHRALTVTP